MDDHRAVYEALHRAQAEGVSVALATVIHTQGSMPRHAGSKMVIYADGTIVGTIGGGAMESLVIKAGQQTIQDGQTQVNTYSLNNLADGDPGICGGTAQIFIEPVGAPPQLLVVGGGHVGKALAELGKWSGFRVVLSDDRPEYCNADYVSGLDEYLAVPPADLLNHVTIHNNTYIAAMTRGLPVDVHLIPALLATPAAYIGVIGSRRRWAITVQTLEQEHGLPREQLARVRAPVGLELQAETPREIAVSIMAEIIMLRRGGTGQPMTWLGGVEDAET
jgi:xanthine dehydrogenase accessory factor